MHKFTRGLLLSLAGIALFAAVAFAGTPCPDGCVCVPCPAGVTKASATLSPGAAPTGAISKLAAVHTVTAHAPKAQQPSAVSAELSAQNCPPEGVRVCPTGGTQAAGATVAAPAAASACNTQCPASVCDKPAACTTQTKSL